MWLFLLNASLSAANEAETYELVEQISQFPFVPLDVELFLRASVR
ncbi:MAG: hypothetical protein ACTS5A_02575 [Candidatus Hodgkinia cicadicola]